MNSWMGSGKLFRKNYVPFNAHIESVRTECWFEFFQNTDASLQFVK